MVWGQRMKPCLWCKTGTPSLIKSLGDISRSFSALTDSSTSAAPAALNPGWAQRAWLPCRLRVLKSSLRGICEQTPGEFREVAPSSPGYLLCRPLPPSASAVWTAGGGPPDSREHPAPESRRPKLICSCLSFLPQGRRKAGQSPFLLLHLGNVPPCLLGQGSCCSPHCGAYGGSG